MEVNVLDICGGAPLYLNETTIVNDVFATATFSDTLMGYIIDLDSLGFSDIISAIGNSGRFFKRSYILSLSEKLGIYGSLISLPLNNYIDIIIINLMVQNKITVQTNG